MSDALTYREVQRINDELAVNGFIRKIDSISTLNIPVEIVNICIVYYHISKDRFDPTLHSNLINVTGNIAYIKAEGVECYTLNNAYLSNIVDNGCHHWEFKINKRDSRSFLYIGIWNNMLDPINYCRGFIQGFRVDYDETISLYYGVNFKYGKLRGSNILDTASKQFCDKGINGGDIIHMYLDLEKNELRYDINNKIFGKAFDIPSASYRAVVSVGIDFEDQEIELLSYS